MPIFSLRVLSAHLGQRLTAYNTQTRWSYSLRTAVSDDDVMRSAAGESLRDLEYGLSILCDDEENRKWLSRVFPDVSKADRLAGQLKYIEGSEDFAPCVGITVLVPDKVLEDLVDMAQHQIYPKEITVTTFDDIGMKYGWRPDGSEKLWDIVGSPSIPIEEISLRVSAQVDQVEETKPTKDPILEKLSEIFQWQRHLFFLLMFVFIGIIWRQYL